MKIDKFACFCALAGLALGASIAHGAAGSGGGGIVGSKHDMNIYVANHGGTADPAGRVCVYCHAPHHAEDPAQNTPSSTTLDSRAVYSPLWNHALPQNMAYDQYMSATFNPANEGKLYDAMIGPSRLCMSCHDGSVAADSYSGQTGKVSDMGDDNASIYGSQHFAIARSHGLSNDHPVGMVYTDYQTNSKAYELRDPSTALPGNANYSIKDLLFNDTVNGKDNIMTCASCHDVHNGKMVAASIYQPTRNYFLVQPNDGSKICLLCHDKDKLPQ